jgi:hypothetical protein
MQDHCTLERPKTQTPRPAPKLDRTTFETSRLLDFCSEKELTAQTGHDPAEWPLVILKEALDNALDACEETGTPPQVNIVVTPASITISDNGPGMPTETIKGILDYSVRVSSREAYVSPTRGAQGNALKTILAMPYVLDGNHGQVDVEAHGQRHVIHFAVDRIRQQPAIEHAAHPGNVRNGTSITVHWPDSACLKLAAAKPRFLQLADDYTWLNPHLSLAVEWNGETVSTAATAPAWKKWLPSEPTSPHWYGPEEFDRLVFAAAKLAERYDIAIMSTKGMPVVACRHLADELCGKHDIPLLVLHDFDKAGFSIFGTLDGNPEDDIPRSPLDCLREERIRYEYKHDFEVIDLGLRLPDVRAYELEPEAVRYKNSDPTTNLAANGATQEEIDFLCSPPLRRSGQRVELNAFTSGDFIRWIKSKLKSNGIKKVVPDGDTLAAAYRRALQVHLIREQLAAMIDAAQEQADQATLPKQLEKLVQKQIKQNPTMPWDMAIKELARANCKTQADAPADSACSKEGGK